MVGPGLFSPLRGNSGPWIFWPRVFRISPAQILPHLRVGVGPKAGQVIRHLLGTVIGGQKVQEQSHFTLGDSRRFLPAKKLLNPGSQYGWPSGFIAQCHAVSAG